jgi:hypothetical protein
VEGITDPASFGIRGSAGMEDQLRENDAPDEVAAAITRRGDATLTGLQP